MVKVTRRHNPAGVTIALLEILTCPSFKPKLDNPKYDSL